MNDKHYRYCFSCDKWKTKEEINEVDWGEQPGGGIGKCYYCNVCRKDLGDASQLQIFRCHDHNDEILKVWGVIDGENKEKIFFDKCPQKGQEQKPPQQPSKKSIAYYLTLALLIAGVVVALLCFALFIKSIIDNRKKKKL